jgi:hypothetical protein
VVAADGHPVPRAGRAVGTAPAWFALESGLVDVVGAPGRGAVEGGFGLGPGRDAVVAGRHGWREESQRQEQRHQPPPASSSSASESRRHHPVQLDQQKRKQTISSGTEVQSCQEQSCKLGQVAEEECKIGDHTMWRATSYCNLGRIAAAAGVARVQVED